MTQKLEPKYGLFTAISMVIGQVIGSGIFFKIDDVLVATKGNVLAGLVGFITVGISVVFAAISMANYTTFSKNGGLLEYVEFRFGRKAAAYVGWGYLVLFFPILTAVLLVVSGIYIANFLADFLAFEPNFLHYCLIGLVNGFLFLVMNIYSPKSIGIFQQMTTVLKLIPLILISAIGIVTFLGNETTAMSSQTNILPSSEHSFLLLVLASLVPIAFSMDGWYTVLQISGEIKNAEKNLPKSLIIGTIIVLLVYVFYYLGIISKMNSTEIISLKDTYITEFARKVAANTGAIILQLFIIISVLGACNGLVLATTRAPYQFYQLDYAKKFWNLGKISPKTNLPINSIIASFFLIIIGIILFYLTSVLPFFTENNYDISAIPIAFIYIVNGALFLGLFKLIRETPMKGKSLKYIMLVFAILGNLIVLIGTFATLNGLSYFIFILLALFLGKFAIKK